MQRTLTAAALLIVATTALTAQTENRTEPGRARGVTYAIKAIFMTDQTASIVNRLDIAAELARHSSLADMVLEETGTTIQLSARFYFSDYAAFEQWYTANAALRERLTAAVGARFIEAVSLRRMSVE